MRAPLPACVGAALHRRWAPAMLWLRPETDVGSAGKQPARDTGVAADDRPGCRPPQPPRQAIGVAECLKNPRGRRPQGARGQSPPPSRKRWLAALQAASHPSIQPASVLQHTLSQTPPNPSETPELSQLRVDIQDGSFQP